MQGRSVEAQFDVLAPGREDLLAEQVVARIRRQPLPREVVLVEGGQHADHGEAAPRPARLLVGRVERRAQGVLQLGDAVSPDRAGLDIDLDVELTQLGLERRVGNRGERGGVRHRRVARLVDEVELDLQAQPGFCDLELPVGEHHRQRVEAARRLLPEQSAVLTGERPFVDMVSHGQTVLARGVAASRPDPSEDPVPAAGPAPWRRPTVPVPVGGTAGQRCFSLLPASPCRRNPSRTNGSRRVKMKNAARRPPAAAKSISRERGRGRGRGRGRHRARSLVAKCPHPGSEGAFCDQ